VVESLADIDDDALELGWVFGGFYYPYRESQTIASEFGEQAIYLLVCDLYNPIRWRITKGIRRSKESRLLDTDSSWERRK